MKKNILNASAIFLRIPKTASTSVETILMQYPKIILNSQLNILPPNIPPNEWNHKGLANLWIDTLGEKQWKQLFSFSIVRNPYDRAVSSWHHVCRLLRKGRTVASGPLHRKINTNVFKFFFKLFDNDSLTFDDFLYLLRENELIGGAGWHSTKQRVHLVDQTGNIIVDFIAKYEHIQDDFNNICSMLDIPLTNLPLKNRSVGRKEYTHYYNRKRKKIVESIYMEDIESFEYDF